MLFLLFFFIKQCIKGRQLPHWQKMAEKVFALFAPWSLRWASRQWWPGRNRRPGRKKTRNKNGRKRAEKMFRALCVISLLLTTTIIININVCNRVVVPFSDYLSLLFHFLHKLMLCTSQFAYRNPKWNLITPTSFHLLKFNIFSWFTFY